MIAVDTNILVYAHREDSPFHAIAYRRIAELAEGHANWAIPWPCLHEFISLVTNRRGYSPASTLDEVFRAIQAWMGSPTLVLLSETSSHWKTIQELLQNGRAAGPLIHDAKIAAICLQHGVRELWSADRDFSRFARLKTVNPLIETLA